MNPSYWFILMRAFDDFGSTTTDAIRMESEYEAAPLSDSGTAMTSSFSALALVISWIGAGAVSWLVVISILSSALSG